MGVVASRPVEPSLIWLYIVAAAASLLLSVWAAWAASVPNPDAALYLRAAELFASGSWQEAATVHKWPAYSILIAGAMTLTGLDALASAQLINGVFAIGTTLSFIGLTRELADYDRLVTFCSAAVILLQPKLTEFRGDIIRDHGFYCFLVLTLLLLWQDCQNPRIARKIVIIVSIICAGLFRIEGFYLVVLVTAYYFLREPVNRTSVPLLLALGAGVLLVIPGIVLWANGTVALWITGQPGPTSLADHVSSYPVFRDTIIARVDRLKLDFLLPHGHGQNSWPAYIGIVLALIIANVNRAMTPLLALLTLASFWPKALMPRRSAMFVLWFGLGQLPVLFVYTFVAMFIDQRYTMGMVLILSLGLPFLLARTVRFWNLSSWHRVLFPVVSIIMIVVWALEFPGPTQLGHLKEAGLWISRAVPGNARVLTNDSRIAYFSGRPYDEFTRVWVPGYTSDPAEDELTRTDYFAFVGRAPANLPAVIVDLPRKRLVRSFHGENGTSAWIYARDELVEGKSGR